MEVTLCEGRLCDGIVKSTGKKCEKKACYQDHNEYRCGTHSNKDNRIMLVKIKTASHTNVIKKYTLQIFLERAKNIHGDKFDYSQLTKQDIKNANSKIKIICKICDYNWMPSITVHINHKRGCPCCGGVAPWTLDRFLEKALLIHNNHFDYSCITEECIKNSRSTIKLICNACKYICFPSIDSHINGKTGCPDCGGVAIWNLSRFLIKANEIHGNTFDYSMITKENIIGTSSVIKIACNMCKYTWQTSINSHIYSKSGCPECSGKVEWTLVRFIFRAEHIHGNKFNYSKITDEDINGANGEIDIICNACTNAWSTTISSHINKKSGCPFCVYKTEQKLFDILILKYELIKRQFCADWCKRKRYLPFDFILGNEKIIIELDGDQHFMQISNWQSPEIAQEKDIYKMKCANENGYSVIRILQKDVFKDKYDWLADLIYAIEKIKIERIPQNIFLCKNNEYNNFGSLRDPSNFIAL